MTNDIETDQHDEPWGVEEEIEALVETLTAESQRREDDFIGDGNAFAALGEAAGFDGAVLLRLARVCEQQQGEIRELRREVRRLGGVFGS